jgi:hypothetical protein
MMLAPVRARPGATTLPTTVAAATVVAVAGRVFGLVGYMNLAAVYVRGA